jgi:signal transduction histidine kinase
MQIRSRLTLQFLLLGGIIMIIASIAIYGLSASFRKEDFYNRLRNDAVNTARLFFEAINVDTNFINMMERGNPSVRQDEKVIILNYSNNILYSSDKKGEIKILNPVLERIRRLEKVFYRQGDYEIVGTLYSKETSRYVVIAAATDLDGLLNLAKLKYILLVVNLVILILFYLAGRLYSGRALKPMSDVVKKVEDISITSLNLRVSEGNGNDEISRLAKTFNRMLQRLETSFAMQKDFIANASHELRTPLTSINGQLEVLMMKDRSTHDYKSALESILEDIRSLIDLSNRLLLIARTSAENPVNLNKRIRIDDVIWQAQEEMKRFNNNYRINIFMNEKLTDSEQMIVAGDEYLLKVAVSNIIDNACKYSDDHSVEIRFKHTDKWIDIIFKDRGIGIPKEDTQKIFEHFYRGSNTISIPGSGIGLSLVSQIIRNHNGNLNLTSEVGKGTVITIKLPLIS